MSILGNRVLRIEDPKFLTVGGDLCRRPPARRRRTRHVRPLDDGPRPASSRRRLRAPAMPGVLAVVTAADLDLPDLDPRPRRSSAEPIWRPLLATDACASSASRSSPSWPRPRPQAADARRASSSTTSRCRRWSIPRRPTRRPCCSSPTPARHVAMAIPADDRADFAGCEVVVEQRIVNQRVAAAPMEPRAAAASWDGRPAHRVRPAARARTRCAASSRSSTASSPTRCASSRPTSAAASAPRGVPTPRSCSLAELARAGRPAGAVDRDPHREHAGHGPRPRPGADGPHRRQPRRPITAYSARVLQDAGAYPGIGRDPAGLTRLACSPASTTSPTSASTRRRSPPTPRRSAPSAAPGGPRRPPPSSGPSICSPPRSAWTRPRCAAATSWPPRFPYTRR